MRRDAEEPEEEAADDPDVDSGDLFRVLAITLYVLDIKGTLSSKFGCFWLLGPKNSSSLKVYHSYFHFAKAWHNFIENMCSNLNNQYLVLGELYPLNKLIILPCCCLNYLRSLRLYFYISIYPRHYWNLSIQICIRRHSHHSIVSWHNC